MASPPVLRTRALFLARETRLELSRPVGYTRYAAMQWIHTTAVESATWRHVFGRLAEKQGCRPSNPWQGEPWRRSPDVTAMKSKENDTRSCLTLLMIWNCKTLGASSHHTPFDFEVRDPWCLRPGRGSAFSSAPIGPVRPWVAPIRVGARSRPEGGAAAPTESTRRQLGGVIEVSVSRCFSAFQQATSFTDTLGMSLVIPCPVHDSSETFHPGNVS
jgi:hypothetical protein